MNQRRTFTVLMAIALSTTAAASTVGCAGDDRSSVRSRAGETFTDEDIAEYHRRFDHDLVRCMRDDGFRYVTPTRRTLREQLDVSAEEFTTRYGYGITTLIEHQAAASDADHNTAFRDALPPHERGRYDKRLADCHDTVRARLGLPPNVLAVPDGTDDGYLEVSGRARADPRVADARRAYAACMAADGFSADSGEAVQGWLGGRVAPVRRTYLRERERRRATGEDVSALRVADVLTAGELAAFETLKGNELRAAAADFRCGPLLYPVATAVHQEHLRRYLDGK